ncbi:MAG: nitrile hydratase subunit beta, partial [Gammaproteobacteria bacterium]|nr:nitrile hydratase subunit beta [Gammaproteobacteria bacterium]
MDGIHDLGGRHGFGKIDVPEPEEQFHQPWEARVRGIVNAMSTAPDWNLDWFRHCRELIEPCDYLGRPYFDQWVQSYCAMLVNSGIATVEELASGKSAVPLSGMPAPMSARDVKSARLGAKVYDREIDVAPAYVPGDAVHARRHGIPGHTRLPAYVRGHAGHIFRHHGAHVFPDANALGERRFEHLYTVEFAASELWGEAQQPRHTVYLNLWESYLEPL